MAYGGLYLPQHELRQVRLLVEAVVQNKGAQAVIDVYLPQDDGGDEQPKLTLYRTDTNGRIVYESKPIVEIDGIPNQKVRIEL